MKLLQSPAALKAIQVGTRVAAPVSGRLAGAGAARLWFTPWPVPVSDRGLAKQRAWLEGTEQLWFWTSTGRRLHGFAAGDGPVVLLVHGWGEWAANLGAFIDPLVNAGYRVVGFDLPAHGRSSGTQTDAWINAEAVREVAVQAGGIHGVVAHSMGGHATAVALHQGLEANAVALLAPVVRLYEPSLFGEIFSLPQKAVDALRETIERRYGAAVWQELSVDRLVPELRTPALIVHDSDDVQVAADDVRTLADAWKGARFVATEGLGHGRIIRDETVVKTVVGFLDDHAAPAYTGSRLASG